MTVVLVEVLSPCAYCGGAVRVHKDLASGRLITTNAHEDAGSVHECAEMAQETVTRSLDTLRCPTCGSPDVALTSMGRWVELLYGGTAPPYLDHVCAPSRARAHDSLDMAEGLPDAIEIIDVD